MPDDDDAALAPPSSGHRPRPHHVDFRKFEGEYFRRKWFVRAGFPGRVYDLTTRGKDGDNLARRYDSLFRCAPAPGAGADDEVVYYVCLTDAEYRDLLRARTSGLLAQRLAEVQLRPDRDRDDGATAFRRQALLSPGIQAINMLVSGKQCRRSRRWMLPVARIPGASGRTRMPDESAMQTCARCQELMEAFGNSSIEQQGFNKRRELLEKLLRELDLELTPRRGSMPEHEKAQATDITCGASNVVAETDPASAL